MKTNDREVIQKIAECISELGGEADIIAPVASWKDSLDNDEVLNHLDIWLKETVEEKKLQLV